jgi:hypothetical protein
LGDPWVKHLEGLNKDFIFYPTSTSLGSDPKRIQRRLRTTQNSQKQLRMLRMASTDREREKKFKVLKTQ